MIICKWVAPLGLLLFFFFLINPLALTSRYNSCHKEKKLQNICKKKKKLIPVRRLIYLNAMFTPASESSEPLSELETIKPPDPMAFSNCNDNLWSRLGRQEQHFQPDV